MVQDYFIDGGLAHLWQVDHAMRESLRIAFGISKKELNSMDIYAPPKGSGEDIIIHTEGGDFSLKAILKRETPMEPIVHPETKYHYETWDCPVCKRMMGRGQKYCGSCGQKVGLK